LFLHSGLLIVLPSLFFFTSGHYHHIVCMRIDCVILEAIVPLLVNFLITCSKVISKRTLDKVLSCLTPLNTENFSGKLFSKIILPSDCYIVILNNLTKFAGISVCFSISYIFIFFMESKACLKSPNNTYRFISYSYAFFIICLNIIYYYLFTVQI